MHKRISEAMELRCANRNNIRLKQSRAPGREHYYLVSALVLPASNALTLFWHLSYNV